MKTTSNKNKYSRDYLNYLEKMKYTLEKVYGKLKVEDPKYVKKSKKKSKKSNNSNSSSD